MSESEDEYGVNPESFFSGSGKDIYAYQRIRSNVAKSVQSDRISGKLIRKKAQKRFDQVYDELTGIGFNDDEIAVIGAIAIMDIRTEMIESGEGEEPFFYDEN